MTERVTVAAFDFDGTLTHSDTVVPFLRRFVRPARFAVALIPHAPRLVPVATRRDRDGLRSIATEIVFTGREQTEVLDQARSWGADIAEGGLRSDTTARLRWHLAQDHRVVIVSASYEPYVKVVAAEFGRVDVVATRLELDNGRCTGRLHGANCRGPEKVRRAEAWLTDQGLQRDEITVYAYGDSTGDRELLAWADHPQWVNEPLASVAP